MSEINNSFYKNYLDILLDGSVVKVDILSANKENIGKNSRNAEAKALFVYTSASSESLLDTSSVKEILFDE